MNIKDNIPNLLTASRIITLPLFIVLFFFPQEGVRWAILTIYILACITDYFDGYFARRYSNPSTLGTFLDPIADKLLVATLLLLLVAHDKMSVFSSIAAIIILCREILISGLREFLSDGKTSIPVSQLAKWKTTLQMSALGILIVADIIGIWLQVIGELCLWAAAIITLYTGYQYVAQSWEDELKTKL